MSKERVTVRFTFTDEVGYTEDELQKVIETHLQTFKEARIEMIKKHKYSMKGN